MSFAERFDQTKRITFRDQAQLAADHNEPMLRPFVSEQTCEGERDATALFYDSGKATRQEGRVPGNTDSPANRRRRWLMYQPPFRSGEYIDNEDVWQGMFDYQSPLMMHHSGNMKRFVDEDVILAGIFGDAYEGKLGGETKTLPSTQVILATVQDGAGTAAVGLNLKKLRENRKLFAGHKFDLQAEPIVIAVTAEQIDDLSDELKLTSQDYQAEAAPMFNREGKLMMVWNHIFVEYQNLTTKAANYGGAVTVQRVPTWRKSSVRLGIWEEISYDAFPDSSKDNALYMRYRAAMDCRRLEDTGVSEIECLIG